MSKSTKELVEKISNKKTKERKPFVERATKFIDYQVLPYIAIAIMVVGTSDSAVSRVKQVQSLPEMVQGGIVVVALAFIFSRAFRFFSGRKTSKK